MGRRAQMMALLLAVLAGVFVAGAVAGQSREHRIYIPGAVAGRPPAAAPTPPPVEAPLPIDVVSLINQHRRAAGCGEVQRDDGLAAAAQRHSGDMALNDFINHVGSDGSTFGQRARAAGYAHFPSGEIIAAGYTTPAAAVQGWIDSPGHRRIMLDCANTDAGAAMVERTGTRYRYYWTAVFGRQ